MGFLIYWYKYDCVIWFFGAEYITQDVLNNVKDKFITINILRTQSDDSLMCRFSCIAFRENLITGKYLLDYTNLFYPNKYIKNDKMIYHYFKDKYGKWKHNTWR